GGEALDDFLAQPLGGLGARRRRALLRLQLGDRFLERRREDRLARIAAHRTGIPRCREELQHGEGERRRERRDDRRQAEKGVGARSQMHGTQKSRFRLYTRESSYKWRRIAIPLIMPSSAP